VLNTGKPGRLRRGFDSSPLKKPANGSTGCNRHRPALPRRAVLFKDLMHTTPFFQLPYPPPPTAAQSKTSPPDSAPRTNDRGANHQFTMLHDGSSTAGLAVGNLPAVSDPEAIAVSGFCHAGYSDPCWGNRYFAGPRRSSGHASTLLDEDHGHSSYVTMIPKGWL